LQIQDGGKHHIKFGELALNSTEITADLVICEAIDLIFIAFTNC